MKNLLIAAYESCNLLLDKYSTTRATRPYLLERVALILGLDSSSTFITRLDSILDFLVLAPSLVKNFGANNSVLPVPDFILAL